ncbi:MAG: hypothetical protein KAJ29_05900, partial [Alphaproteobacteria bacterium]|nr:hypothetical protein [Alphaproteobacteria bacterium]
MSLCVFLTLFASLCVARDRVSLRTGMHSDYARLVFGWPTKTDYTLEQGADGQINIRFDNPGMLDMDKADFGIIPGINSVEEISQEPLSIRLKIPAGSKLRDFSIGKRVVIDVYMPEDIPEAQHRELQVKAEEKPQPIATKPKPKIKNEPETKDKPEPVQEAHQEPVHKQEPEP